MFTGLAQLVEHWSPKPGVGSSSLSTRAKYSISIFIKKKMAGLVSYVKESFEELKSHVSWPSFNEGLNLTVLVAVFSVIFSLIIWGLDSAFSRVIKEFFNLLS